MENSETGVLTSIELAEMLNDSSIDRVMAIDACLNIVAWNKISEELSGTSKKDVLGRHLLEMFPAIKDDEEMMNAITGAFRGYKTFLPSSPGLFNREHVENHFIPLKDERGEIFGVMNIMHDVAHRIKVEKQLIRLNKALEKKYIQLEKANSDLATFTYMAGHDIKEPLRNVYTSIEMLVRSEGSILSNSSKGNLRKMQASLNRMNLMLDDILTISRIGQVNEEFNLLDLNEIILAAKKKIADKSNINLIVTSATLPAIQGSRELVTYLFEHLFSNAVKFQEAGKTPEVTINYNEAIAEYVPGNPEPFHQIIISDNGIGFESSDAERIFDMFTRLHKEKYRGSGIGLTICKRIMDTHEGMIAAESSPGNGASFICYFPAEY